MARSMNSRLSFWDVPQTNCGLQKFKELFFILSLSLCLLAECEGSKRVPVSTVTLPKDDYKTKVTFDPATAFRWLAVSADGTYAESRYMPLPVPDNPERFNSTPCLLGLPGFTSGKHYWEVEYGNQEDWDVGVALESVERKKPLKRIPEEGIWVQSQLFGRAPENGSPPDPCPPGIFLITLGYEDGRVQFCKENRILNIPAGFNGEKVFPFFYLGRGVHLKILN